MRRVGSLVANIVPVKRRPRVSGRGGAPRVYTPPETAAEEREIARLYKGGKATGPVRVTIRASLPLPKSRPKRVESEPCTVKPDIDNVAKAVLDALNGIAYEDDSQVVDLRVTKEDRTRGVGPCTRVEVDEL